MVHVVIVSSYGGNYFIKVVVRESFMVYAINLAVFEAGTSCLCLCVRRTVEDLGNRFLLNPN